MSDQLLPPGIESSEELYTYILESAGFSVSAPRVPTNLPTTKIGIIDSVYDATVEELPHPANPYRGRSLTIENSERYVDTEKRDTESGNHGTKVLETIRFFDPEAEYYLYQVADESGNLNDMAFAEAVEQAIEDDVDLLNVSSGAYNDWCEGVCVFCIAAEHAIENGITVIAAAGNQHPEEEEEGINCPGRVPGVITVGGLVSICGYGEENGTYPEGAYWNHEEENVDHQPYPQNRIYCGQRDCDENHECVSYQRDIPWKGNVRAEEGKPEVLAPVHAVYNFNSTPVVRPGSSFAAPVVTGNLSTVIGEYRKQFGEAPDPDQLHEAVVEGAAPIDVSDQLKLNVSSTLTQIMTG